MRGVRLRSRVLWRWAVGALCAFCLALVATPAGVSGAVLLLPIQLSALHVPSRHLGARLQRRLPERSLRRLLGVIQRAGQVPARSCNPHLTRRATITGGRPAV
jgi:hypothetical protein